ncbi:MAG: serine/threonine protein kinase, partial [Deltaproteobacteria bacterium]|nr:serine/threonine protein kinase [Deltaproteobacteria bacterium]
MVGETIGNFRIVSLLGKGGMGEVWLAENTNTGARVAIKLLLTTISADTHHVQRLFNEAIAVSRIPHAGIVRISDSGFHEGQAYLVMELLEGESLYNRVERVGPLPLAQVCEIGIQIAGVLEATHAAGVTHRDLKPDNIFLVPDASFASGERVKVLDFGLAKLQGNPSMTTSTMTGMGTPLYMSPEQWRSSANVDGRADLYSLGCVIFEMACGRPPFEAASFAEACAKHLAEIPPLASDVVTSIPESLDRLLARMLIKNPALRPALVDVRTALDAIRNGRAIALPRILTTSDVGAASSAIMKPAGARSSRLVVGLFGLGALAIAGGVYAVMRTPADATPLAEPAPDPAPPSRDGSAGPDSVFVSPGAV